MMMRLDNLQFIGLLPHWMRGDAANVGLANGIDKVSAPVIKRLPLLSTWDKIDELDEWELDEIAWEWNLFWYALNAPIETKRQLIKTGLQVWSKLGTPWACEQVISAYFGTGYISEWFEYGGKPGTFKVYSTNPEITGDRVNEFLYILNMVKRGSAQLDGIFITLTGEMPLYTGFSVHDISRETYKIGDTLDSGPIIVDYPTLIGGVVVMPEYPDLIDGVVVPKDPYTLTGDSVVIVTGGGEDSGGASDTTVNTSGVIVSAEAPEIVDGTVYTTGTLSADGILTL